ncbi:hypothetical protein [Natrinema sp. H-ect4]|uniref:hypothetical protein n=1 Tax=Natrinema sp. H-ect4 TaxID=3242699 RepID=UPI0035A83CB7
MDMAASTFRSRSLTLERVESVERDATVRHVDQLDSETLAAFYGAITGDRTVPITATDLEPGEVIVFTDYYRVKRV